MEGRSQTFRSSDKVSAVELKRLLHEIHDLRPDICIRLRLLGQMWQPNFWRVFVVTETGAVLFNEQTSKAEIIGNFAEVVQFEIDSRFQNFQPHNHYTVQMNEEG